MFGLGMSEMVLIGIVALIVIGPKDLPGMFRTLGQFTGKARGMAREFSRAMEAAAEDSGIKDVSNTIRAASDPKKFGTDALKNATGFSKPGPMPSTRAEAMADAADHLSTDAHETAARAKVPAKPATAVTPPKPAAAAKTAPTKAAVSKPKVATPPKPETAPKAAATPKAPVKPKRPAAAAKAVPVKPEDQS